MCPSDEYNHAHWLCRNGTFRTVPALGPIVTAYDEADLIIGVRGSSITLDIRTIAMGENIDEALMQQLMKEAVSHGKDYFLQSVTMMVRLGKHCESKDHTASVRTIYTIEPLRNGGQFVERYTTGSSVAQISHWYGSEKEVLRLNGDYDVAIPLNIGAIRTVVTGANYRYTLPSPARTEFDGRLLIDTRDHFWSYLNQEDYIVQLLLLVEAEPPIKIKEAHPECAIRRRPDGTIDRMSAHHSTLSLDGGSISGRWQSVQPGEQAGLYLRLVD